MHSGNILRAIAEACCARLFLLICSIFEILCSFLRQFSWSSVWRFSLVPLRLHDTVQMVSNLLRAKTKENQTIPPANAITLFSVNPFLLLLTSISSLLLNPSNLHPIPPFWNYLEIANSLKSVLCFFLCALFCCLHGYPKRLMCSINMDQHHLTVIPAFDAVTCSLPTFFPSHQLLPSVLS